MTRKWLGPLLLVMFASACGGGSGNNSGGDGGGGGGGDGGTVKINEIEGTIMGTPVVTKATIAGQGLLGEITTREILLSSVPTICEDLKNAVQADDAQDFAIHLFTTAGNETAPANRPGTYQVVKDTPALTGSYARLVYRKSTADQNPTFLDSASGSVTITEISAQGVKGSLDATMTNGDKLKAKFDAEQCASLACGTVFPCF